MNIIVTITVIGIVITGLALYILNNPNGGDNQ